MDDELHRFQNDLLELVREMNASRIVRFSETQSLQMKDCFDVNMSLSATHFKNVSLKSENSDT